MNEHEDNNVGFTEKEAEITLAKACHLLDCATSVMSKGSERKQEIKEFFEDIGYPSLTFN